jgi:AcrR family transcriptional regulator
MIEKNAAVRARLLECAVKVIGRYGYAGCSIARVTAKAKVAYGTFYMHFKSQQALFEAILPGILDSMRGEIATATRGANSVRELERTGATANFSFLKKYPYHHRAFYEAEVYAPRAYTNYFEDINKRYSRALQRQIGKNAALSADDKLRYEAAAAMLEGARTGVMMRYGMKNRMYVGMSDEAIDAYVQFAVGAINALFENKLKES